MYFEEPIHGPVSSAFLTEAHKNMLLIIIFNNKKKKNKKNRKTKYVRMSFEFTSI